MRQRRSDPGTASASKSRYISLALDLEERKALECRRRFPFPETVDAVDSGSPRFAGAVRAQRCRGTDQEGLGLGEVEGGGVSRREEQVTHRLDLPRDDLAAENGLARHAPKALQRLSLAVLDRESGFGVEVGRQQPGDPRPHGAQPVRSEEAAVDQRLVDEVPAVRVTRIEPAELGEELPRLELQPPGEGACRGVDLFQLDHRFAFG